MSTQAEVLSAAYELRQAKVEYEYHLKQIRYHLANLARCRVEVNAAEHHHCNVLEKSGLPDPDDERSRVQRMLTQESARNGIIYTESDASMLQERIAKRKAAELHKVYLQNYLDKKRAQE